MSKDMTLKILCQAQRLALRTRTTPTIQLSTSTKLPLGCQSRHELHYIKLRSFNSTAILCHQNLDVETAEKIRAICFLHRAASNGDETWAKEIFQQRRASAEVLSMFEPTPNEIFANIHNGSVRDALKAKEKKLRLIGEVDTDAQRKRPLLSDADRKLFLSLVEEAAWLWELSVDAYLVLVLIALPLGLYSAYRIYMVPRPDRVEEDTA